MPETRMLPLKRPRSTGIERTNLQSGRPVAAATGTGSHVTAAPGVGNRIHQHVLDARNPAANAGRAPGRQDAKVEIIDRRGGGLPAGGGGGMSFSQPTVQLLQAPAQGARGDHAELASPPRFSVDELNLIGSLLGQYEERARAINDADGVTIARRAILTCGDLIRDAHAAPAPRRASPPTRPPAPETATVLSVEATASDPTDGAGQE